MATTIPMRHQGAAAGITQVEPEFKSTPGIALQGATESEKAAIAVIEANARKINDLMRGNLAERSGGALLEAATKYLPEDRPILAPEKVNDAFWAIGEAAGSLENISQFPNIDEAREQIRRSVAHIGHRFEQAKPTGVLQKLNTVFNVHEGVGRETSDAARAEAGKLSEVMSAIERINAASYNDLGITESQGSRLSRIPTGTGVGGR